jgi:hypothetical protein
MHLQLIETLETAIARLDDQIAKAVEPFREGKVHSRRTLKGAVWVKTLMTQVVWTAVRTKNSYFRSQFYRLGRTTGDRRKAIVAVAASILTVVYHMIREGTPCTDLGVNYFDERNRAGAARRLVARLRNLGDNVQVTEAVA